MSNRFVFSSNGPITPPKRWPSASIMTTVFGGSFHEKKASEEEKTWKGCEWETYEREGNWITDYTEIEEVILGSGFPKVYPATI